MDESAVKAANELVLLTLQMRDALTAWEAQHAAQLPEGRREYLERLRRLLAEA
jgi:hypothetical protein